VSRDEQSHAVPGQRDVKVLKPLLDEPVLVREAFPRRGPDKTVPDLQVSDSSRL
jgi:hypothetical protein